MPLATFVEYENGEQEVRYGRVPNAGNPDIVKKRELELTQEEFDFIKNQAIDEVKDMIEYFLSLSSPSIYEKDDIGITS